MNNSLAEVHPELASEWSEKNLPLFPALAVSYYSNKKGLKAELGSDRLLGVPLETYIASEKLAIESGSADENIEIMKAYMCKQRGIRLIKLPMKGTANERENLFSIYISLMYLLFYLSNQ